MKLEILSVTKSPVGKKDLPEQFGELIRPDIVKRAVESIQSNTRQPYGGKPYAGMRSSAELSRRRKDYRGSYGKGISRVPRKIMTRRGSNMFWVGAFAPGTVGGRKAHPPKSQKIVQKKINKKERRKAIRSAIAATIVRSIVEKRGHIIPKEYPFIVESKIELIANTRSAMECLTNLGFEKELERVSEPRMRSGRGKLRGRLYREKRGPLIVVSKECPLMRSAANIPGVEIISVDRLNADILAPGADIGRATIFSDSAVERLAKERLFTKNYHGQTIIKEKKEEIKTSATPVKAAKPEAKQQKKLIVTKQNK